jgi:hypothetical protein
MDELNSFSGGSTDRKNVRFEVLTAVTLKNTVSWDVEIQFVPHRRHITSPLQSPDP